MRYYDTIKLQNPIDEARRYVANARDTLQKNGQFDEETGLYEDSKYVKAAGHYLWSAMLLAMEAVFHVRGAKIKKKGDDARVDIDDYKEVIAQRDRKLLGWVVAAYNITHLYMGYDGIQDKDVCIKGIHLTETVIDRCASMMGGER